MLLATRNYIRNRWAQQQTQQTGPIGREALTTTDLNLRAGPSSANDRVGMAAAGSRVKVLSISGSNANWCEVQVLEHSRPKTDPSFVGSRLGKQAVPESSSEWSIVNCE